jgi:transcription elongation factor Elf1
MSASIRVKKIRLGDEVATQCGRCKAERTHQVAALNQNGTPAIVICRTCGGRHNFREKGERKSTSSVRSRQSERDVAASAPRKPARAYSAREAYSEGEWIDHPKFGQGEVIASRDGKIEVKFGTEKRILIHAH